MNIFFYKQYEELHKTIFNLKKEVESEKEINEQLKNRIVELENLLTIIQAKITKLENK